jgi:hypothetical protein
MKLLREPLMHFFALGVLVFVLSAIVRERTGTERGRIVVTPGQIEHLAIGFARTWQRPPTAAELDGLIDDYVREEICYREATAMGLDRDDTIVRRRMRQKLEFITEDAAALTATEEDLQGYLRQHPEAFRTEARLSFRQLYVSPDRAGRDAADEARALLTRLAGAGSDVTLRGDSLMVPDSFDLAAQSEVARLFGEAFAARVAELEPGRWAGPVQSGYGWHVVFVRARIDGHVPELALVRDAVQREWLAERRKTVVEATYQKLRERYDVVVERPVVSGSDAVAAR